jgi:two-component system sensor histidine kinase/response regulator
MEDREKRPHILVVDDDPTARETLEALLIQADYDLTFAASGQEALARLDVLKPVPDAILLDVMMPGLDGFEVCRRIKANKQWQHIPVILVTALDTREDLVRGLDAGADEFLSKPVNGPELRARVRSVLRIKRQFDRLEATMQLREDLSRMIVHDIRSPLTVILMTLFAVRQGIADPQEQAYIDTIEAEARRLDSFMDDLLMMAKMQEDRLILNRSPINVNMIVQTTRDLYRAAAESKNIELAAELSEERPPLVSLDESLFRRVLDNLLSNALKFSPSGSTVALRVDYPQAETQSQADQPLVRVQVVDQGPGIPEEHRERIFDQFEIVELKKGGMRQVGLGLAFCKLAIEAHGGHISVDDNEPQGSIFTVEI